MYQFHTLKNGMRLVCEQIPYVKSVTVGFWIQAGSVTEQDSECGISHFIEHMLFKGTTNRSAKEIVQAIDWIGGHINAFTSTECTCLYTKTLSRHIGTAIEVLCDMLQNSSLSPREIEIEKKVILEEINMCEDMPDELCGDLLAEGIWGGTPLGRPILGTAEGIKGFSAEKLRAYMDRLYYPQNIVVAVCGNFDLEQVIGLLEEHLHYQNGQKNAVEPECPSVFHEGFFKREKDVEQTQLCLGFPGLPRDDDAAYSLMVLNTVFGGGMSSRLFQKIREEMGLAYSVGSYLLSYKNNGILAVSAGMSPDCAADVAELVWDEIRLLRRHSLSDQEIRTCKEQLAGNYIMGLESVSNRMSHLGKSRLLLGSVKTPDEILQKIDAVDRDSIEEVIGRVFGSGRFAMSAVGVVESSLERLYENAK